MIARSFKSLASLVLLIFGFSNAVQALAQAPEMPGTARTVPAATAGFSGTSALGSVRAVGFSWVDITASGKALTATDWVGNDDEGQASVALPWSFPWFGGSYTTLTIDPNGNLGFDASMNKTWNQDNRIPSANTPNNRIAAFYEDMAGPGTAVCGGEGGVYTYNDAANGRFIVEYTNWCSIKDSKLNTFEALLYSDGRVIVQYLNVPSGPPGLSAGVNPGPSAVGVEGPGGASGLVISGAASGQAWQYDPSASGVQVYLPDLDR